MRKVRFGITGLMVSKNAFDGLSIQWIGTPECVRGRGAIVKACGE